MQSYVQQDNDSQVKDQIRQFFENFLNTYEEIQRQGNQQVPVKVYHKQVEEMAKNTSKTFYVNFKHLMSLGVIDFIQIIYSEYYRYEETLKKAVTQFIYSLDPIFASHKNFALSFFNLHEVEDIRQLKTDKLGKLIQIKGTVTKTTEARPELIKGNFQCKLCNVNIYGKTQQFKYTQPKKCSNPRCTNNNQFSLIKEGSVFDDWQKIKLQESSTDLPSGAVPRTVDVILRGDLVEKAQPGDRVLVTGTLIVVPDVYSMLKPGEKNELSKQSDNIRVQGNDLGQGSVASRGISDLSYKLVFMANNIVINQLRFQKENNIENFEMFQAETEDELDFLNKYTDSDLQEIE